MGGGKIKLRRESQTEGLTARSRVRDATEGRSSCIPNRLAEVEIMPSMQAGSTRGRNKVRQGECGDEHSKQREFE